MTIRYVVIGLALVLAACSSDSDKVLTASGAKAALPRSNSIAVAHGGIAARTSSFAMLPDRGNLIGYLASAPQKEGLTTWHRADVSEEHALRAIATGKLRMTTPDGQTLEYRYLRHVEYPNGNWTWIGELPGVPGRQAIITFGERAAFGQFGRPGAEPLQLTVRNGVAWMVEVPPKAWRGVEALAGQTDYLLPPELIKQAAATKQAAAVSRESLTAAATPTVDVALGYTAGFASRLGGQSQAITRLTQLVAITNQAYVSSHLTAQVRLVRTMQVSYPDNTKNDTALSELSGSDGSSSVAIPASLLPLRQARDQYGADLVSLVRNFNEPENAGCGIAWLIGGGSTAITTADAPWGYSVVSDGSDGGFFCREETLAHELGHNMGQAHNVEDSGDDAAHPYPGAHPYSYGYREASATGFFTIMAYRAGDSQYSIPYFANPNVTYQSRPTGVANASDNVRSMAQTMPLIATFRSTVIPLGKPDTDFDGDGRSDILWRGANGANALWPSADASQWQVLGGVADLNWKIVGVGDFDGDGRSDILWRNAADGRNSLWKSANSATGQTLTAVADLNWKVVGVGDFDGDDKSDILWRNSADGRNSLWRSASSATGVTLTAVADLNWKIVGAGDFDGDGKSDILWRNSADGRNSLWKSASAATGVTLAAVADLNWKVVGVADFDGDGRSDILWRNSADGRNSLWKSANSATGQTLTPLADLNWRVAGAADFDGDGKADIFWRNFSTGANALWKSANSATGQVLTSSDLGWVAAP
ncbi:MAG TPA: FG-GAP-like repeat-containing protein [Lysobacter sp.]|jgi:uncharacterized membrane protein YuzA (DUF378 family)|nr:FG-GAP-like repeat-containing protein [Lysobacter sp.]